MPFARIRLENTVASQSSQKSQIWDFSLSQYLRKQNLFAGCLYGNPALVTFVETFGKDMRSMRLLCNGALACWLLLCRARQALLAAPALPGLIAGADGSTCPAGPHRGCLVCELECTAFAARKFTRSIRCVCTSLGTASVNTKLAKLSSWPSLL